MKWSYTVRIDASMEAIYEYGFAPEHWFSFYPGFRWISRAAGDWPDEGSTVILHYSLLGTVTIQVRQTVVEHDHGRRIQLYEEALGGLWVDHPEFTFETEQNTTRVTITVDPTSKFLLARPLVFAVALLFARVTPRAMEGFKKQVEQRVA